MTIGPRLRSAAPLAVVLLLALHPIFYDLGGPWLWDDEADTAVFARRIVATGLPIAWDGRTFLDSDNGLRIAPRALGHDFVLIGTPWLPYYATAASFALLGAGNAAARLPFAIAALATIALLYDYVRRTTGCRRAALAAVILLLASTQFLLYARESRSYAFNMLFTVALLGCFVRLAPSRARTAAARPDARGAGLAVAAVLLFHTQIMPAVIALATCGSLALFQRRFRPRLGPLLWLAPWVALFTLPWIVLTWSETQTNWMPVGDLREWLERTVQFGTESMLAIPWLGWMIGLPLLQRRFTRGDRDLLAIALCYVALTLALFPLALPKLDMVALGVRYVCALIPVAAAVTGVLVARASDGRPLRYAVLLLLFGATQLAGNAMPWLAIGETSQLGSMGPVVSVPRALADKILNANWWYLLRGLGTPDPGTLPRLVEFLNTRSEPDDIVLTNFSWDGLYFYTDRRLAYRISPNAVALRDAARRVGLPSYVTSLDGVNWVVWRHAAAPLPGMTLDEARAALESRGARVEAVASVRDVIWENRPELQWHRFPGVGFPFAPRRFGAEGQSFPDAVIYRVRWPGDTPEGLRQPDR